MSDGQSSGGSSLATILVECVPQGGGNFESSNSYDLKLAYRLSMLRAQPTYIASLSSESGRYPGLERLRALLDSGAAVVLTASGQAFPGGDSAPGAMLKAVQDQLSSAGLPCDFSGYLGRGDGAPEKNRVVALLSSETGAPRASVPGGFSVMAVMATYNEADIIESTIAYLLSQGVHTYVIDNWSDDGTFEIVNSLIGKGVVGVERFPPQGSAGFFPYSQILARQQDIASQLGSDWVIRYDADERRRSPWPGVTLRDALYHVQSLGYNAVDHAQMTFHPVDDAFRTGDELEEYFRYFEFERAGWAFAHVKAWKPNATPVDLISSGGHEARFSERRIFPYKFLLKHYPVRSQSHGVRKVLKERQPRFDPVLKARRWHVHYDHIGPKHQFVRSPSDLIEYDEARFFEEYVAERLASVGVPRENSECGHSRDATESPSGSCAAVVMATEAPEQAARMMLELAAESHPPRVYVVDEYADEVSALVPDGLDVVPVVVDKPKNTWDRINDGLRRAAEDENAKYFLVLDPEMRISPAFVDGIVDAAEASPDSAITMPAGDYSYTGHLATNPGRAADHVLYACEFPVANVDFDACVIPREVMTDVGLLDSTRSEVGCEAGLDYAVRTRQAGHALQVTERCLVNHLKNEGPWGQDETQIQSAADAMSVRYGSEWRGFLLPESSRAVVEIGSSTQEPAAPSTELVMTMRMDGDFDLAARSISLHVAQGVGLVLATGPQAARGAKVLKQFLDVGTLKLLEPPGSVTGGADMVNWLNAVACRTFGARAVFHCAPSDFWIARSGSLLSELTQSGRDALIVSTLNVLLSAQGKQAHFTRDAKTVVLQPYDPQIAAADTNPLLLQQAPTLLSRSDEYPPQVGIRSADSLSPCIKLGRSEDIVVLRYPIKDWKTFVAQVKSFSEGRDDVCDDVGGLDWDALRASFKRGELERDFRRLQLTAEEIATLTDSRVCAPLEAFIWQFARRIPAGLPGVGQS